MGMVAMRRQMGMIAMRRLGMGMVAMMGLKRRMGC
jgi:hypothetical protein